MCIYNNVIYTDILALTILTILLNFVDISRVTGVAEGTIRNSYKDLHPHAHKIVPSWFAKTEELRNLCAP